MSCLCQFGIHEIRCLQSHYLEKTHVHGVVTKRCTYSHGSKQTNTDVHIHMEVNRQTQSKVLY